MATINANSHIASITQGAVDFVMRVIRKYCERRDFTLVPGPSSLYPASLLNGMRILKERCHLEYPLLNKKDHFRSGTLLALEERHGRVFVHFRPTTELENLSVEETSAGHGLIELGEYEEPGRTLDGDQLEYSLENAIRIGIRGDTDRLGRFRGPNLP